MRKTDLIRSFVLVGATVLIFNFAASAQTCDVTTINGSYGFVALQAASTISPPPSTGTTTATSGAYSDTSIGQLLQGIANGGPFSAAGRVSFDGAGDVFATSTPGGTVSAAGSYSVYPDCSVAITLTDPFGTNTTATSLQGITVGQGTEVDASLVSATPVTPTPGSGTTSSGNSSSVTSGPIIRFTRLQYASGCTVSNLSGSYTLVANGVLLESSTTGSSGTVRSGSEKDADTARQLFSRAAVPLEASGTTNLTVIGPVTLLGIMRFDGSGNISPNPALAPSPLSFFQFSGTYSINSDCTGTMTLMPISTASTSSSQPLSVNFFLARVVTSSNGSGVTFLPEIEISIFSTSEAVAGTARVQ